MRLSVKHIEPLDDPLRTVPVIQNYREYFFMIYSRVNYIRDVNRCSRPDCILLLSILLSEHIFNPNLGDLNTVTCKV